jgi:hypothetical protein
MKKCPQCDGTRYVPDPAANPDGSGTQTCPLCNGMGKVGDYVDPPVVNQDPELTKAADNFVADMVVGYSCGRINGVAVFSEAELRHAFERGAEWCQANDAVRKLLADSRGWMEIPCNHALEGWDDKPLELIARIKAYLGTQGK